MVTLLEEHNIGWNSWTYKKVNDVGSDAYSVQAPRGYDEILRYVHCLTPTYHRCKKPKRAHADATMLQLAKNDSTQNSTFEPSVVRALFGNAVPVRRWGEHW